MYFLRPKYTSYDRNSSKGAMLKHFDASDHNLLANASTRRYKNAMHTSMAKFIRCQNLLLMVGIFTSAPGNFVEIFACWIS